jgi:hypothetical protein
LPQLTKILPPLLSEFLLWFDSPVFGMSGCFGDFVFRFLLFWTVSSWLVELAFAGRTIRTRRYLQGLFYGVYRNRKFFSSIPFDRYTTNRNNNNKKHVFAATTLISHTPKTKQPPKKKHAKDPQPWIVYFFPSLVQLAELGHLFALSTWGNRNGTEHLT